MERHVIITGLTGRTGYHFLQRLKAEWDNLPEGTRFTAIVRASSDVSAIRESGLPIALFVADIARKETLLPAMERGATLLHIAGIHWSLPVIGAAVKQGVGRIIAVHTTGVYSKFKCAGEEYRKIDAACKKLCADENIPLTILRPTMIYGGTDDHNVSVFIRLCDRLPLVPVVSGARYLLQPVHREDLGNAYFEVLTHPEKTCGREYVLSGEKPILLREMLSDIRTCLGKKARFVSCPYFLALSGAWTLFLLSFGKLDLREKVMRLVEDRAYPHDKATRDFGFSPMPFSEGVSAEVTQYLAEKTER